MRLSYTTLGDGPRPTVLLHGYLGSGRNLRSLAGAWGRLAPERRFLLPDLTGHGASPPLPANATLRDLAADVRDTALAAGFTGPVEVVGHSQGGRVALEMALDRPSDIASVTLLDISPGPVPIDLSESGRVLRILLDAPSITPDRREMRATLTGRGLPGPLADWLLMNTVVEPEGVRWRIDRAGLAAFHVHAIQADLWAALSVGTAVRCIRGGASFYVSDLDAARMETLGCRVTTLAGAGHYVHVDAPDALLSAILAR